MVALKDKKKFGGNSTARKNKHSKKGYNYGKEFRKLTRREIANARHKALMQIPLSEHDRLLLESV